MQVQVRRDLSPVVRGRGGEGPGRRSPRNRSRRARVGQDIPDQPEPAAEVTAIRRKPGAQANPNPGPSYQRDLNARGPVGAEAGGPTRSGSEACHPKFGDKVGTWPGVVAIASRGARPLRPAAAQEPHVFHNCSTTFPQCIRRCSTAFPQRFHRRSLILDTLNR